MLGVNMLTYISSFSWMQILYVKVRQAGAR